MKKKIGDRTTNWVGITVLLILLAGLIGMAKAMEKAVVPDVEPEPIEMHLDI